MAKKTENITEHSSSSKSKLHCVQHFLSIFTFFFNCSQIYKTIFFPINISQYTINFTNMKISPTLHHRCISPIQLTLHFWDSQRTGPFPVTIASFTMSPSCLLPQRVHEAVEKLPWASISFSSGTPATGEGKNCYSTSYFIKMILQYDMN